MGQRQHPSQGRQACWRASDAEREQVAAWLGHAMVEGRLSCSELEERLVAVYLAKTFGELDLLTADLPLPGPGTPSPAAYGSAGSWLGDGCRGAQQRPTNTLAVLSFVSAFAFFPLGVVLGLIARQQIKRSGEEGLALALAGLLISLVHFLSVVAAVVFIVVMPGHPVLLH